MRPLLTLLALLLSSSCALAQTAPTPPAPGMRHLLYVAVPGIRNYAQYGGNGILVFDIDHDHKFVRRINVPGMGTPNKPEAAYQAVLKAASVHGSTMERRVNDSARRVLELKSKLGLLS